MRIALQPCAADESLEHYRDTILAPVPLAAATTMLPSSVLARLTQLYPEGAAPMWGLVPGPNNLGAHDALRPGDEVLFAGKGRVFARASVTLTWRSPELARELWGTEYDEP